MEFKAAQLAQACPKQLPQLRLFLLKDQNPHVVSLHTENSSSFPWELELGSDCAPASLGHKTRG